jgi:hypothetical protein
MSAESGVDGARWSVDHSNSGITATEGTADSSTTTTDNSNGTSTTSSETTSETTSETSFKKEDIINKLELRLTYATIYVLGYV